MREKIRRFADHSEGALHSMLKNPLTPVALWTDVAKVVAGAQKQFASISPHAHTPVMGVTKPPVMGVANPPAVRCKWWRGGYCRGGVGCPNAAGHVIDEWNADPEAVEATRRLSARGAARMNDQRKTGAPGGDSAGGATQNT